VKQIVILLIIFLVIRFLRKKYLMGYVNRQTQAPEEGTGGGGGTRDERVEGEEMVLDPVCDSYIPLSSAIRAQTPSGTEYFCSTECRDKFLAS